MHIHSSNNNNKHTSKYDLKLFLYQFFLQNGANAIVTIRVDQTGCCGFNGGFVHAPKFEQTRAKINLSAIIVKMMNLPSTHTNESNTTSKKIVKSNTIGETIFQEQIICPHPIISFGAKSSQ